MTVLGTLAHNLIAHPIAGVLWALGKRRSARAKTWTALGDVVHGWWSNSMEDLGNP